MATKKESKPGVIRDTVNNGERMPYARIPIINKFPLPNENTHPIEALFLYLRYLSLIVKNDKKEECLEIISKALEVFKTFEVVDTENI